MNLQTLRPSYRDLALEARLRFLEKIRANRPYPTGRMCNYTSWALLPDILNNKETSDVSASPDESLDSPKPPARIDQGLLSLTPGG